LTISVNFFRIHVSHHLALLLFIRLVAYGNRLIESIPSELGHWRFIQELRQDLNNLSGTIPASLGNLIIPTN